MWILFIQRSASSPENRRCPPRGEIFISIPVLFVFLCPFSLSLSCFLFIYYYYFLFMGVWVGPTFFFFFRFSVKYDCHKVNPTLTRTPHSPTPLLFFPYSLLYSTSLSFSFLPILFFFSWGLQRLIYQFNLTIFKNF